MRRALPGATWVGALALLDTGCSDPCVVQTIKSSAPIELRLGDAVEPLVLGWEIAPWAARQLTQLADALEHRSDDDYRMSIFAASKDAAGALVGLAVTMHLPVQVGDSVRVTMSSKTYNGERGVAGMGLIAGPASGMGNNLSWAPSSGTLIIRAIAPLAFEMDVAFRPEEGDGLLASVKGTWTTEVVRESDCPM